MTITYPRELPAWLRVLTPTVFAVSRDESRNRRRDGTMQIIERSDPFWRLELQTGNLTPDRQAELEAFLASLSRGSRDFLYRDPRHLTPRTYPGGFDGLTRHGGGAFDGTATVTAISPASITVSGLPSTFALKAGDRFGLVEDGEYCTCIVMEDATAAAGVVTLAPDPMIRTTIFSTAASANFLRPAARMLLTDAAPMTGARLQGTRITADEVTG